MCPVPYVYTFYFPGGRRINLSLTAVRCFGNGYVGKQPVAWKGLNKMDANFATTHSSYCISKIHMVPFDVLSYLAQHIIELKFSVY